MFHSTKPSVSFFFSVQCLPVLLQYLSRYCPTYKDTLDEIAVLNSTKLLCTNDGEQSFNRSVVVSVVLLHRGTKDNSLSNARSVLNAISIMK